MHKKYLISGKLLFSCGTLTALGLVIAVSSYMLPLDAPGDIALRLGPISREHPLGCDLYGQDLFYGMIKGARTSLYVVFWSLLLSTAVGTFLGVWAGYWGKTADFLLMRWVDILMAFPGILLALALAALLGPSVHNVIIAIAATGWTSVARLTRSQVLTLKTKDYMTASLSLGASSWYIIYHHILPSLWVPLVITTTFSVSSVILMEASLSFLGLGAVDHISWGSLLNQGRSVLEEAPRLSLIPGSMLMLVTIAINVLGDELRDRLDPHHHRP